MAGGEVAGSSPGRAGMCQVELGARWGSEETAGPPGRGRCLNSASGKQRPGPGAKDGLGTVLSVR